MKRLKQLLMLMALTMGVSTSAWADNVINGHEYVDLGLPSGTLWATCNVGATNPEDLGAKYAWGETATKDTYTSDNYKWGTSYTKYNATDQLTALEIEDDVANKTWGGTWLMPSFAQFCELRDYTTQQTTTVNGVSGVRFTSKSNSASIFIPKGESTTNYWAADLYYSSVGQGLRISSSGDASLFNNIYRWAGEYIRPVSNNTTDRMLIIKEAYAVIEEDNYDKVSVKVYDLDSNNNEISKNEEYTVLILRLYYDDKRNTHSNTYLIGTGFPEWLYTSDFDYAAERITDVSIDPSFADYRPTTCSRWFYGCKNLERFGSSFQYLNTSEVTNMSYMFSGCSSLRTLDLSTFDTSNVTDMSYMFAASKEKLTRIDGLTNWNTSKVTNMKNMFENCWLLTSLDLSSFNTSNVTNMNSMFYGDDELETIYVRTGWNMGKVENASQMFLGCDKLVGGKGTTYDNHYYDGTYARIDKEGTPGYLTEKLYTVNFYYGDELLFTRTASIFDGTVSLPSTAEMLGTYALENVTYTYNAQPFTAATVVPGDIDVTVNGTSNASKLTIGDAATSSSYNCPYGSGDKNSTSQIIYEASELSGATVVKGIAFKVADAYELATTSVDIYLGHKEASTFSAYSDYLTEENLTHVYSGNPTLGKKTGWEMLRFNLDEFVYNGTDNLVVVVCRKSDSYNSSLRYYYESKSDHALRRSTDSNTSYGDISYTMGYSKDSYRPSAQFLTIPYVPNEEVTLTDNEEYLVVKNRSVASATYKKTLGEERVGKYQAWFVPFDYTLTTTDLTKFDFFKINMIANAAEPEAPESDDVYIFLNPMAADDVLKGNMPYVYRPKSAVEDYEFTTENVTLLAMTDASVLQTATTKATYDFYGTYANTTATAENPFYYITTSGTISRGTTVSVGPYRWILRATTKDGISYAPSFSFIMGGETTGIDRMENGELRIGNGVFNLAGQRVAQPSKGLYIMNGRKVVIK